MPGKDQQDGLTPRLGAPKPQRRSPPPLRGPEDLLAELPNPVLGHVYAQAYRPVGGRAGDGHFDAVGEAGKQQLAAVELPVARKQGAARQQLDPARGRLAELTTATTQFSGIHTRAVALTASLTSFSTPLTILVA